MESESEARGTSARAAMLREYLTDPEHLLSVDQDGTRWAEVNVAEVLALLDALDAAEERLAEIAATALIVERERDEALERLAAVRALAEDWIPSGDETAATCGWAITAVLDDPELAAITVKSLGRRCGLEGCADPTCGGDS